MEDASAAGPYDQWPCQRGFDRFYGFLDGETDQFHPELVYDNHRVDAPDVDGYHLTEDLVTRAIALVIDGSECGSVDIPFVMLIPSSTGSSVGFDHGSPVSPRYANPFAFEGILDRVDIRIVTPPPSTVGDPVAAAHVRQWMSRQ